MADNMSNDILKNVFQELHVTVVNDINIFSVVDELFAAKVISTNDMHELHFINNPREKCRQLLIILHRAKNPRTFIELRKALTTEDSYSWLVEEIDKKYNLQEGIVCNVNVRQCLLYLQSLASGINPQRSPTYLSVCQPMSERWQPSAQ